MSARADMLAALANVTRMVEGINDAYLTEAEVPERSVDDITKALFKTLKIDRLPPHDDIRCVQVVDEKRCWSKFVDSQTRLCVQHRSQTYHHLGCQFRIEDEEGTLISFCPKVCDITRMMFS